MRRVSNGGFIFYRSAAGVGNPLTPATPFPVHIAVILTNCSPTVFLPDFFVKNQNKLSGWGLSACSFSGPPTQTSHRRCSGWSCWGSVSAGKDKVRVSVGECVCRDLLVGWWMLCGVVASFNIVVVFCIVSAEGISYYIPRGGGLLTNLISSPIPLISTGSRTCLYKHACWHPTSGLQPTCLRG